MEQQLGRAHDADPLAEGQNDPVDDCVVVGAAFDPDAHSDGAAENSIAKVQYWKRTVSQQILRH